MAHHYKSTPGLFAALWLFIALVSVVDGALAFRFRYLIHTMELNPIGQMLLAANSGHVWVLLAFKFAGTIIACATLLLFHRRNPRLGILVASGTAALQLCLLLFLLLG